MEKINVAELLKDCPKGMELDCTMYEDCKFLDIDTENDGYLIRIITPCGLKYLDKYGRYTIDDKAKCVIFPKGKTTWEGFQRPFKDGDVCTTIIGTIFIYKKITTYNDCGSYVSFVNGVLHLHCDSYPENYCRLATEEEKQELFQAIKDNGYKWNTETKTLEKLIEPKFKVGDKIRHKDDKNKTLITITGRKDDYYFIQFYNIRKNDYQSEKVSFKDQDKYELVPNKFDINTLEPFEKVLVRYGSLSEWNTGFFSHTVKSNNKLYFIVNTQYWEQCIPYKGNEYLRGTTDDCSDYFKTWE